MANFSSWEKFLKTWGNKKTPETNGGNFLLVYRNQWKQKHSGKNVKLKNGLAPGEWIEDV